MDSILESVKTVLGIPSEDNFFNDNLVLQINSIFSILRQIGCGPAEGYQITGPSNTWDEFLTNEPEKLQLVKSYLGMRVRQYFDPPTNSTVLQALDRQVSELEWRISTLCDPGNQP